MSKNYKYRQKRNREMDKNARALAFFWKFIYPIGVVVVFAVLASVPGLPPQFALLALSASLIIFGIVFLRSAVRWTRMFVFIMQYASHGRRLSSLHMIKRPDRKIQREGCIIGSTFLVIGILLFMSLFLTFYSHS